MSEWISVEDDKPDNGARVLFTWINVLGNRRTTIGCFTRPFGICAENEDGIDELDYEGWFDWTEHGTPYRKEGWYEEPHESLPWAICLAIIESKGGMGDE